MTSDRTGKIRSEASGDSVLKDGASWAWFEVLASDDGDCVLGETEGVPASLLNSELMRIYLHIASVQSDKENNMASGGVPNMHNYIGG